MWWLKYFPYFSVLVSFWTLILLLIDAYVNSSSCLFFPRPKDVPISFYKHFRPGVVIGPSVYIHQGNSLHNAKKGRLANHKAHTCQLRFWLLLLRGKVLSEIQYYLRMDNNRPFLPNQKYSWIRTSFLFLAYQVLDLFEMSLEILFDLPQCCMKKYLIEFIFGLSKIKWRKRSIHH